MNEGLKKREGLLSLLLTIALAFGCLGVTACGSSSSDSSDKDTAQQASEENEKGTLSFTVEKGEYDSSSIDYVVVLVTGKTSQGNAVNEKYKAVFGQKYDLEYGAGSYEFALSDESKSSGEVLFKASANADFDGRKDNHVVISVEKDMAAMAAAAEKKAAEEKAAAEKAAAEQAAAQKAAAEQAAAEEAAASSQTNGAAVYVASSGKGKKYHSTPTCSNMKGATELSQSEAESRGYTPCSKCW